MIEAVVAAGHDHGVHLRCLDQRHALVGGAVDDLVAARGEALALLLGVRRGLQIDSEAALLEKSSRLRGEQRQRLRAGKHHDGELGLVRWSSLARTTSTASGSEPWCRPGSAAKLYPAWWMACACIARMLGRVVVPPFGALGAARQVEAENLLDLFVGQDEIVSRSPS